jgi:hypothetical protein
LELLEKFLFEADKITSLPHRFDFFNFVVTASVLSEWVTKHYKPYLTSDFINTFIGKSDSGLPKDCENWITDKSCFPNVALGATHHILNSIRICWHTTNATKHYKWMVSSGIKSITDKAPIENWYDYCFTQVGEGIFIRYHNETYTIEQVKNILIQFYPPLLRYLESKLTKGSTGNDNR